MAPSLISSVISSVLSSGTSVISRGSLTLLCSLSLFCPRQVCFDRLGCFENDSPWVDIVFRPHVTLPQRPVNVDVSFFYTAAATASKVHLTADESLRRSEVKLPTSLEAEDEASETLKRLFIDADPTTNPLVFLVHGFFATAKSDWILGMRDAFVRFQGASVVRVNWNTSPPNYMRAVADARVAGAEIGLVITRLASRLPPSEMKKFLGRVHVLGHSLGAHVASYAGNFVQSRTGFKIGRITGLDPAGPAFQYADPKVRLDSSDANFVDAIHTNAAPFISGWGMEQPVGHVDFYPNGGQNQPGCVEQQLKAKVFTLSGDKFGRLIACHHKRACYYFMETLIPRDVRVQVQEKGPNFYDVNWSPLKLTFSVTDNAVDDFDAHPDDWLARTLKLGGARAGTTHIRGQCGFHGVLCNDNLDVFGELKPDCGAVCVRVTNGTAPSSKAEALTTRENGFPTTSSETPSSSMTPSLCVPLGYEAATMADRIKQFLEVTRRDNLKMYLETNNVPPFCRE